MAEYVEQGRFKLREAEFFFEQMKVNFQNRDRFLFYLDAFLSSARSITFVIQKARGRADQLMEWYDTTISGWKQNNLISARAN